ncbi:MAG: YitT family protein [Rothia dentocariosa]
MTHHLHMRILGHRVMRYAGITLGCLIASSAINLFLVPAHLLTGGATGIAMIVYYLFGLPIGLQTFVYNIPLLFMAWKLMGRAYTVDIIIGTAIFSFLLDLTRPFNAYAPVKQLKKPGYATFC